MTLLCYNGPVKVKVFAKLNLILNVGAKQGEFHPIDSVATSVDLYDQVEVVKRNDNSVNVYGVQCVAEMCNTAYKAAVAFIQRFQPRLVSTSGVDITIRKGIPFGAGLGGSSADAAAVVYCMCKLFGVDIRSREISELCSSLGSDVNFMLFGGLGRLQGKGDDVTFYQQAEPLHFALTTFDVGMSSKEIYTAYDCYVQQSAACLPELTQVAHRNDCVVDMLVRGYPTYALKSFENNLQPVVESNYDYCKSYIAFVSQHKLHCCMTGSGSAFYVACCTQMEAQRVADLLNANGFTTTVCTSVPSGIIEIL